MAPFSRGQLVQGPSVVRLWYYIVVCRLLFVVYLRRSQFFSLSLARIARLWFRQEVRMAQIKRSMLQPKKKRLADAHAAVKKPLAEALPEGPTGAVPLEGALGVAVLPDPA